MMNLLTKAGEGKLATRCTFPLTRVTCVSRVYTDAGVLDVGPRGATMVEIVPDISAVLESLVLINQCARADQHPALAIENRGPCATIEERQPPIVRLQPDLHADGRFGSGQPFGGIAEISPVHDFERQLEQLNQNADIIQALNDIF